MQTFYSFADITEFQNFLRTASWKDGELDYITLRGSVYTMDEYDHDGLYLTYYNKKNDTQIRVDTPNNRYKNGFKDATVEAFLNYGTYRNDIVYAE